MDTELTHIGYGNFLRKDRVVAILPPNSAPTKRLIHERRSAGLLIDMTSGRKTKAVLVMDSGHLVLAAIAAETLAGRMTTPAEGKPEKASG